MNVDDLMRTSMTNIAFPIVICCLIIIVLIASLYLLLGEFHNNITGMWEAPGDFCADSGLTAFCLCIKYVNKNCYDGYLLISNSNGILTNRDLEIKIRWINSNEATAELISWNDDQILPHSMKLHYWKEKNKIMLYSSLNDQTTVDGHVDSTQKSIHAILYKNSELSELLD